MNRKKVSYFRKVHLLVSLSQQLLNCSTHVYPGVQRGTISQNSSSKGRVLLVRSCSSEVFRPANFPHSYALSLLHFSLPMYFNLLFVLSFPMRLSAPSYNILFSKIQIVIRIYKCLWAGKLQVIPI